MARHKKQKGKNPGRQAAKSRFRVNDPAYRGTPIVKKQEKHDNAPKYDEDMFDIPKFPGGSGGIMPGLKVGTDFSNKGAAAKMAGSKKKRKRGLLSDPRPDRRRPDGDSRQIQSRVVMPTQKPGESAKAYAVRIDKFTLEHMKENSQKVVTTHQRERRKDQVKVKRDKKKERQEQQAAARALDQVGSGVKDRPVFGDVVERPLTFGDAARKAQSKFRVNSDSNAEKAPAAKLGTSDLSDYANKVREAYEVIKKRRLEGKA
mmetsp:Transcript_79312/g.157092  ORF Transcript_79312/g.157092 Transcript_79312/m.157092 type:complete len:260 (-) Transcript_79312:46-825(-)